MSTVYDGVFGYFSAKHYSIIHCLYKVGQNHLFTVYIQYFWQKKPRNIRSYTVHIYGSGQPYIYTIYVNTYTMVSV